MGFFDWVKNTFGNIVRAITGRPKPQVVKEETKLVNPQIREGEFSRVEPLPQTEQTLPEGELKSESNIPKEIISKEEKLKRLRQKNEERLKGKEIVTEAQKREIHNVVTPTSEPVLKLGKYESRSQLEGSLYDVYKNMLLRNINDKRIVDYIFGNGILDSRIVAYVSFDYSYYSSILKREVTNSKSISLQGLSPKSAVDKDIFGLNGSYREVWEFYNVLQRFGFKGQIDLGLPSRGEFRVFNVKVDFDFA